MERGSMMSNKYVVIFENDTTYMDCLAICDKAAEAYGEAYLALCDDAEDDKYITIPERREGDNGFIIQLRNKKDDKVLEWVTVLFYESNNENKEYIEGKWRAGGE